MTMNVFEFIHTYKQFWYYDLADAMPRIRLGLMDCSIYLGYFQFIFMKLSVFLDKCMPVWLITQSIVTTQSIWLPNTIETFYIQC